MNPAPTTPMAESVRTADLLPRIPALRTPAVHVAHPGLVALFAELSARGWPTGTDRDYQPVCEDDDGGDAGCAFCGWAYAAHERGAHRFCGRHLHLVEAS